MATNNLFTQKMKKEHHWKPYFPQWKWKEHHCSTKFQFFSIRRRLAILDIKIQADFLPFFNWNMFFVPYPNWLDGFLNVENVFLQQLRSKHCRSSSLLSDQSQSVSRAQVRYDELLGWMKKSRMKKSRTPAKSSKMIWYPWSWRLKIYEIYWNINKYIQISNTLSHFRWIRILQATRWLLSKICWMLHCTQNFTFVGVLFIDFEGEKIPAYPFPMCRMIYF